MDCFSRVLIILTSRTNRLASAISIGSKYSNRVFDFDSTTAAPRSFRPDRAVALDLIDFNCRTYSRMTGKPEVMRPDQSREPRLY
jgi:hypothetical protein